MNIVITPDRTMNTEAMIQMMVVAQISMDLCHAEQVAANAAEAYRHDLRQFEVEHGPLTGRLSADAPAHAAVREFTAKKYKAKQVSKRKVYTTRGRLKTACLKLALIQGRESYLSCLDNHQMPS
jgi:hypothetical protein